ncbi:type 2 periplasmic-binding domain-containing protein [Paenibacillus roseipurpureus]|uniref:ABC transporter substrate-binding protein n=1 Tax=Paenibacillus roseopurpureus TaxID=2918901 RepID=A0AA96LS24_9BACL|nr:hypothetical protein [Paenibacillus sp. MBLB1832]WNR46253.1 hypothetical protein MJB10_09210 [Paenibacillus sp. MBLB1832]
MKKNLQVLMVTAVSLSLLLTSACSTKKSDAPAETAAASASAQPAKALPDIDPFKFKDPVTVNFGKSVVDIKKYAEGEDPENNAVYKLMNTTINIVAKNKFAVPFDTYQQKIKLGIASNDIPDIFYADQEMLEELIKNDMLADLTPYYEKYETENAKKILSYGDKVLFKGATKNGKLYGMPNVSDAQNGVPAAYIRKDWLEKLGGKKPASFEELIALGKDFATKDPDGNGKADTLGFAFNNELDLRYTSFMNAYGVYPKVYMKGADGKFTYGSIDPKMKDGLAKLAELYKAGAIDKEFVTQNMPKMAEGVSKGSVGIFLGEFFSPLWPLQDALKNVKGADYIGIPVPGLGGKEYKPYVPINANGYFVVRKGFEHPEALMLILNNEAEVSYNNLNNAWSKGYADINKNEKYAALGGVNNWLPVFLDRPDANLNRYNLFKYAIDNKDDTKMPEDQRTTFLNVKKGMEGDPNNWAWYKTFLEGVPSAGSYKNVVRNDWIGSPTATGKLKGAALKKLEDEAIINIIVGQKPVDEFDAFVKQWKEQGGQQILDEMNAASK